MEEHLDRDALALLALGEPARAEADLAHLAACGPCSRYHAALRDVVALARSGDPEDLVPPAAAEQLWERVRARIARRRCPPRGPEQPPGA